MAWFPCCCGASCTIFNDTFNRADNDSLGSDWTEVSGDFDISSQKLVCASTGLLVCNTAHPDSSLTGHIQCDIYADTDLDRLYVVFNYLDSSNYHYVYVEWGHIANFGRLRVYKRTAGVDTQVGSTVTESSLVGGSVSRLLTICWQNNVVSVGFASLSTLTVSTTFHAAGYKVGIARMDSGVTVDNFKFSKHKSQTPGCSFCSGTCTAGCIDDVSSQVYKVVIAGVTNFLCGAANCTNLNGTYIAQWTSACNWASDAIVSACAGSWGVTIKHQTISTSPPPAVYEIEVRLFNSGGGSCTDNYRWTERTDANNKWDCDGLVDLPVDYAFTYSGNNCCTYGSTPTCYLTSL